MDLPICDGFVPGYVIADAIAAEFAWQILGLYFERTLYDTLTVKREEADFSLWRGGVRLTEALPIDERSLREQAHDRVGWRSSCRRSGATRTGQLHVFTTATPFVNQGRARASQMDGRR